MKILTFTTLFPNHLRPDYAVFIKNRTMNLARHEKAHIKVAAPVPFFPPWKINARWYAFSQIKSFELINGIEVYHPRYIVTPKTGMSLYGLSMFLGALPTVKKIYKKFPFDIIDAHYVYPDGLAAVLLGKYFGKPVVLSARGSDINVYPEFAIIRRIMKYTLASSAWVISVCSSLKDIMISNLDVPAGRIKVISNGIDPKLFYSMDKKKAKEHLGLSNVKKIIVSVGSLIRLKGHHILIKALHLLKQKNALNFHTYIIGDGELKKELETQIARLGLTGDVTLTGRIDNTRLVHWYNAADLFFLGSSREGWPNVISESLACGTPVVATNVNGIPEIICSEDYGILVKRSPGAFADGIEKALVKNWDFKKIHAYGQSRSWEKVASEVYEVFRRLI